MANTSINDDSMSDDGSTREDCSLLDEKVRVSPSSERPGFDEESGRRHGGSVKTWIGVVLAHILLASLLVLPLIGYLDFSRSRSASDILPQQIAIPLHPQEHARRSPKLLEFHWNITRGTRAPDGVEKEVFLVNGLFPGPTIEARSGDRIVVHAHNGLESEGLSLHWHGLRMKGYNSMDGATGFTQCPIAAGEDFTYDFKIGDDEHGTFWWHSHTDAQRGDGLYGGLVVHQPGAKMQQDEALLLIGDWFHRSQKEVFDWYFHWQSLGNEPVPDSLVINSHGRYNCSLEVPARPIKCTQKEPTDVLPLLAKRPSGPMKLRVVNTGTISGISLSAEEATMQPVAVDGGCNVNGDRKKSVGILYPGERLDVLVNWSGQNATRSRLNIYLDDENFGGFPNPALNPDQSFLAFPQSHAMANTMSIPPLELDDRLHSDLSNLTAAVTSQPPVPAKAPKTISLYMKTQIMSHLENRPKGFVNHTSWAPQSPPLLSLNRTSWNSDQLVHFIEKDPDATEAPEVDIILNNLDDGSHPIHLHGYSFQVLSSYRADGRNGWGSYNPYEDELPRSMNLRNPLVKDTVSVPRRGHVILRMKADNPGLWMMHCHMLVHMEVGMVTALQVGGRGDVDHTEGMDESAARLCRTGGE